MPGSGDADVHTVCHVDPGEVLLRLVTQSTAQAEIYARLLQEAFDAAERLKEAHEKGTNIEAMGTRTPTQPKPLVVILIASSTQVALLRSSATRTALRKTSAST